MSDPARPPSATVRSTADRRPQVRAHPRRRSNRTREEAILNAAYDEFVLHGFDGAQIEAVASRAGVTRPTVYNYFDNKSRLFAEAVAYARHRVIAPLNTAAGGIPLETCEFHIRAALISWAARLVTTYTSKSVSDLRRLLVVDGSRLRQWPEIGRDIIGYPYVGSVQESLRIFAKAHFLKIKKDQTDRAARQLLALVLDETAQLGLLGEPPSEQLTTKSAAGVEVFLMNYGSPLLRNAMPSDEPVDHGFHPLYGCSYDSGLSYLRLQV